MHCAIFAYNTFPIQITIHEYCILLTKEVKAKRYRNFNVNSKNDFLLNEPHSDIEKCNLPIMSNVILHKHEGVAFFNIVTQTVLIPL